MTDTNQLPEPELGYIQTDKSNQPAFSARQMREAMRHALQARAMATQAEVADEQIKMLIPCGDAWKYEVGFPEAIQFARAILALRPERVPMTDEEATAMIRETVRGNAIRRGGSTSLQIVRATEAYYGITDQAKKETP